MRSIMKSVGLATLLIAGGGLAAGPAVAQDVDNYRPEAVETGPAPQIVGPDVEEGQESTDELVSSLRGIVIVASPSAVSRGGASASGVEVRGDAIVPAGVVSAAEAYLGRPVSLKSIADMTRDMVMAYRRADLPVVNIAAPEQDISNGVLQLIAVVGHLGGVTVEGNVYYPAETYLSRVTMPDGMPIEGGVLLDDLRWMNRNPFRRVDAIYAPGERFGETRVILKPFEYRPFMVYGGINNDGNEVLGEERTYYGLMAGNLLGLDEVFGYQLTTLPEFEGLYAHVGTLQLPLHARGELQVLGAYVESDAQINEDFRSRGESSQLGIAYIHGLPRFEGIAHDLKIGAEYKSSNNNLEFGGLTVTDSTAEIYQLVLGWSGEKWWDWGHTRFDATLYHSPGDMSSGNTSEVFQEQRALAEADYTYARFGLDHRIDLPDDWRVFLTLAGQISNENLLSSESFTLGGPGSVRGFETNLTRGDNGFTANFTVYTPGIAIVGPYQRSDPFAGHGGSGAGGIETVHDALRALFFVDYGWGESVHALEGESDRSLAGAGVGLTYEHGRYLSADITYGWQIHEEGVDGLDDDRDSMLHFRVTTRY